MALSRKQKQAVAALLISHAGTLVEFWDEYASRSLERDILADVDGREAAKVIAGWLRHLPGDSWHNALPDD